MPDTPDDLTDVGKHHGNQPPTETRQTVRSPDGPDPRPTDANPSPALFQVVETPSGDRVTIRAFSPRAEVSAPDEGTEIGQFRTVDALQGALEDAGIDGWSAVFEDDAADRVLVETDVGPDHNWLGQQRYSTVTFFADHDAATAFAEQRKASSEKE